jgi:phage tail tape-measure protein
MDDTSGYPVIGSVHTLASGGFLTAGCMSVMAGICPKVIGSDAERAAGRKGAQTRWARAKRAPSTNNSTLGNCFAA